MLRRQRQFAMVGAPYTMIIDTQRRVIEMGTVAFGITKHDGGPQSARQRRHSADLGAMRVLRRRANGLRIAIAREKQLRTDHEFRACRALFQHRGQARDSHRRCRRAGRRLINRQPHPPTTVTPRGYSVKYS